MNSTIQYQGYTIKAPPGPSDQGDFAASPTDMQVISQVDNTLRSIRAMTSFWFPEHLLFNVVGCVSSR
jgi:hypothetical protein